MGLQVSYREGFQLRTWVDRKSLTSSRDGTSCAMRLVCDSFSLSEYDNRVLQAAVATHSLHHVDRYVSVEAIVIAMSPTRRAYGGHP